MYTDYSRKFFFGIFFKFFFQSCWQPLPQQWQNLPGGAVVMWGVDEGAMEDEG
jgi:hypothetical protein